ncbi:MAG: cobalt ECF transporter T component CbiQ [Candidatus Bathyarchaeota archaeon]|nr:cobalt ECF transporter T component CbiQ [Candidatus Bathyarchaeota archaeon]
MAHNDLYAQIDRSAYTNRFAKNSPITKTFLSLSALVISVSSPSFIVPIIVFSVFTILILGFAKIRGHLYRDLLLYPNFMLALSCIFIALFFGYGAPFTQIVTPWFTWTIFKSGIAMSITTFLRVEGALSCLFFLVLTTSITDLCIILRRARAPRVLVEMALLIYRYIFVFLEVSSKMSIAQDLRLGHGGWLKRIRSLGLLAGNLFIRTLEQGERTFTAMSARGYDGTIRILEDQPSPNKKALVGIVLFDVLLVVVIFLTLGIGVM